MTVVGTLASREPSIGSVATIVACADAAAANSSAGAEQPGHDRGDRDEPLDHAAPRSRGLPLVSLVPRLDRRLGRQRPLDPGQRGDQRPARPPRPGGWPAARRSRRRSARSRMLSRVSTATNVASTDEHPGRATRSQRRGQQRDRQRAVPGGDLVGGVDRHRHVDAVAEHRRQAEPELDHPGDRQRQPQPGAPAQHPAGPAARSPRGSGRPDRAARRSRGGPAGSAGWPRPPIGHN